MAETPTPVFEIKAAELVKLDLQPGDIVVLMVPDRLNAGSLKALRESWEQAWAHDPAQLLVLDGGTRFDVLRPRRGVS